MFLPVTMKVVEKTKSIVPSKFGEEGSWNAVQCNQTLLPVESSILEWLLQRTILIGWMGGGAGLIIHVLQKNYSHWLDGRIGSGGAGLIIHTSVGTPRCVSKCTSVVGPIGGERPYTLIHTNLPNRDIWSPLWNFNVALWRCSWVDLNEKTCETRILDPTSQTDPTRWVG